MEEEIYEYYGIPFTDSVHESDIEDSDLDSEPDTTMSEDSDSESSTMDIGDSATEDDLEFDDECLGFDPVEVRKIHHLIT